MKIDIWIAIGIVFVVVWVILIWEAWNTPPTDDER
tara:strand:+ start:1064 stop:1168 length:105 start_codon:yes stop_codon:yes gene_type:complete